MRDERTIMAAVIAGGICAHGNAGVTSKPALVASTALGIANAILAQNDAEERAEDEREMAAIKEERAENEREMAAIKGRRDAKASEAGETNIDGEPA
jgi:hypothetical protein